MIPTPEPVVAAVPLDDTTADVVHAAIALARRLNTSVLPIHALAPYPFPAADADAARTAVRAAFDAASPRYERVQDVVVAESSAAPFIIGTALRAHAAMIVVGGHGPTIGGWALGTVADRVTRAARCPVFVARGALPGPDRAILCPDRKSVV